MELNNSLEKYGIELAEVKMAEIKRVLKPFKDYYKGKKMESHRKDIAELIAQVLRMNTKMRIKDEKVFADIFELDLKQAKLFKELEFLPYHFGYVHFNEFDGYYFELVGTSGDAYRIIGKKMLIKKPDYFKKEYPEYFMKKIFDEQKAVNDMSLEMEKIFKELITDINQNENTQKIADDIAAYFEDQLNEGKEEL